MKNQNCQFEGCKNKAIPANDILDIYNRFELPVQSLPSVFWCREHAILSVERAYRRLVGETRISDPDAPARLARLKQIQDDINSPAKHYDNTPSARVARLAEIEAEMAAPTLQEREAAKHLSDLRAQRQRLSDLEQWQRDHAPVSPRYLRFRYLQEQGVDTTLINI